MGTQGGPEYPCIEEGLVFCFDPKNPLCCPGGAPLSNLLSGWGLSAGNFAGGEYANVGTEEGYIQLDGTDDYIYNVNSWATLYGNATGYPFSVSAWCKADTVFERAWIIGSEGGGWGTGMFQLRLEDLDPGSNLAVFNVDGWDDNVCTGAVTFTDWNNIVGTCDSSRNIKIYVNGVAGSTNTADEPSTAYTFAMGADNISAGRPLDGKLGPCMIYNRELSAGEVLQNYNQLKGRFGL